MGIDFGSWKTVIGVARRGNVDIIVNEVSNRSTPSMVSFGSKCRYIGESAKTQEVSNYLNTLSCIKRFLGRCYTESEILTIEKEYVGARLIDINGQVGVKVQFLGKEREFTIVQITAMYFAKIRQMLQENLGVGDPDVVISVPGWFTDVQRRGILDAAEIAGLHLLRLMDDTTAAALSYGIIKMDLPEDKTRNVCMIDVGYSNYSVSIIAFKKGQLTVKASAYDRHLGGRDFDKVLLDYLAVEFKEKYKIDINKNPKAKYRVMVAVEKLKKNLSANTVAPFNIESLVDNVDVSCMVSRENMEKKSAVLLNRLIYPLEEALESAGMTVADIDVIEMIGGSARIPCLKEKISSFFGKPLSFTLNQDEAISRGCAFACAMLSPVFRVREFSVYDVTPYAIQFSWEPVTGSIDEETSFIVFPKNNTVPSTKILTFYRKEPFTIEASYVNVSGLPGHLSPCIGRYHIKDVTPSANGEFSTVKVRIRLNLYGLVNVEQAYVVEEREIQESTPKDELADKSPMSEDKVNGVVASESMDVDVEKSETRKVKKLMKKCDLNVVSENLSLDAATLKVFKEMEEQMILEDKIVSATENQKNALEEYIYDMRDKLCSLYADYASNEERLSLESLLNETEAWLYEEGEDTTKAVYQAKLDDLIKAASCIVQRKADADELKRKERAAREEKEALENAEREKLRLEKEEIMMGSENDGSSSEKNVYGQDAANIPSTLDSEMNDSV